MIWKIFYGDGSTYSDLDGPPERAPKLNVQAIAVKDDLIGRRIESSRDFYCYTDHGWRSMEYFGLFDYLSRPGSKVVLFGRVLPDEEYRALWDVIANDTDLPPKSGKTRQER